MSIEVVPGWNEGRGWLGPSDADDRVLVKFVETSRVGGFATLVVVGAFNGLITDSAIPAAHVMELGLIGLAAWSLRLIHVQRLLVKLARLIGAMCAVVAIMLILDILTISIAGPTFSLDPLIPSLLVIVAVVMGFRDQKTRRLLFTGWGVVGALLFGWVFVVASFHHPWLMGSAPPLVAFLRGVILCVAMVDAWFILQTRRILLRGYGKLGSGLKTCAARCGVMRRLRRLPPAGDLDVVPGCPPQSRLSWLLNTLEDLRDAPAFDSAPAAPPARKSLPS